jgi:DNA polymerase-3 subunit delta
VPVLTLPALRRQLASGDIGPLYALVGADDVEKAAVASEFGEIVDEGLRAFNVERLYGGEIKVGDLVEAVRPWPMLAPRRVVILLEAERLVIPRRESRAAEAEQEQLEAFLAEPMSHATVVFVCGTLDMRRRLVKQLFQQAQVVDCGHIADTADAERWVQSRAAREGLPLEPAAVRTLVARAGADLTRLRSGLERVGLYALGRAVITAEDVRDAVPAGPEAQEDFGIAKAIWRSDPAAALRELGLALDAGAMPVVIMGQLRAAAEKLPGPRVGHAIDAVLRTDLTLKSSGGDDRIALERLAVELCAASGADRTKPRSRPPSRGRHG